MKEQLKQLQKIEERILFLYNHLRILGRKILINWIAERQNTNGGWGYHDRDFICDTSQSQYSCLALFIAKHHNFNININCACCNTIQKHFLALIICL